MGEEEAERGEQGPLLEQRDQTQKHTEHVDGEHHLE